MTVAVPRIPLLMIGGVLSHPWSDRLVPGVNQCVAEIAALTGRIDERCSAELHVVVPVVLFIEVGRASRCGLTDSGMLASQPVSSKCACPQGTRERGIALRENSSRNSKRRCILACRGRVTCRPVFRLDQPLRFPRTRINGAVLGLAPCVV